MGSGVLVFFFKGNKMTPDINLSHLTPATRTVPASVFGEHLAGERDCLGYQVETLPAFARTRIPVLNPCHFFNEAHYRTLARGGPSLVVNRSTCRVRRAPARPARPCSSAPVSAFPW